LQKKVKLRWSKYLDALPGGAPSLLEGYAGARASGATQGALRGELDAAPVAERAALLQQRLAEQLAQVLGLASAAAVEPTTGFAELGVDSLLSVELKNRLESSLAQTLPATLLFDHPDLATLGAALHALLYGAPEPSAVDASADALEQRAQALGGLDDDELERRLAAELEGLGGEPS